MAWTLAEGAVTAIRDYLVTNLPTKLDALDTAYGDGITLDDIVTSYLAEQSLATIPAFPVLFVIAPASQIERWTPSVTDASHHLLIGVIAIDQDPETLRKRLYRYMRATWEVLVAGRAAASFAYVIGPDARLEFSPIYSKDEQFMGDARVEVSMRLTEQQ